MSTIPIESRRARSFRFSLRRMLIAVALCAIGLSVASQWLAVQRRSRFLESLRSNSRVIDIELESDYLYGGERLEGRGYPMPTLRRWLGDEGVLSVTIAGEPTAEEREQIKTYFPEARVKSGFKPGSGIM